MKSDPDLLPPWETISGMLTEIFYEHPSKAAVIDGDIVLSYQELETLTHMLAARMAASGLEPGDRVAIWADNCWQWVVSAFACWWRGCILVPLSSRSKYLDVLPVIKQTQPKLIFMASGREFTRLFTGVHAGRLEDQSDIQSSLTTLPLISTFVELSEEGLVTDRYVKFPIRGSSGKTMIKPAAVEGNDICEILYTSGSTGFPKGVPRRHSDVLGNRWASSVSRGFSGEDVLLALPDFAHTLGLNGVLLRSAMLGATMVICTTPDVMYRATLIQQHNVTVLVGAPSMFDSLLMAGATGIAALSRVRLASIGSSAIRPELVTSLLEAGVCTVTSGYGMTECDSVASAVQTMGIEAVAYTVGKPEFGIELKLVNESGNSPGRGNPGEILIRGYCVCGRYYKDEIETARAYTADGWLKTGDLGRWTDDGYLQIVGRKKDVISIHGYKVYPAEVERLLLQSGMLQDVCVIGIANPFSGQECVAFLKPSEMGEFDVRAFRLWAKSNIAVYKIPTRIIVTQNIPLNKNGKVDRLALESSFASGNCE